MITYIIMYKDVHAVFVVRLCTSCQHQAHV
jgi:hypothetical protein